MLKRKKIWLILLYVFSVFLAVPSLKADAAPAKKKAAKAYKEFLAKDKIPWDANWEVPAKECKFSLIYIDKDNIPELVLYNNSVPHMGGYCRIFTYKNGKVTRVGTADMDGGKFYYYKKKGVFISCYVTGGVFDNYRKVTKGKIVHKLQKGKTLFDNKTRYYNSNRKEISKSAFNRQLKKLVGSKKKTSARFYPNTPAIRKKRCR